MALIVPIFLIMVVLLLLASGFAIVFVYFPRWLLHRYKLDAKRRIIARFALAGLLVSVFFTCIYFMAHTEIITGAVILWPTVMILMDLDGHPSATAIIGNFALAILSNIGLYAWLGVAATKIRKIS